MKNKNIAIGIIVFIGLGLGAYFIFSVGLGGASFVGTEEFLQDGEPLEQFVSPELLVSFGYPKGYILEEKNLGNGERLRKQILLIEDSETNRALLSGDIVGDGPTSITIDVFQNNLDNYTAESFIRGNANSNYKMGDGDITPVEISGFPGFVYGWDGLYRGESAVFATDKYVYMASVTYIEGTDKIVTDFMRMLKTLSIDD
ncbi:MAG: hypothetical protein AAB840_02510 [Patescibacteria group bacterium]